jgi:NAD-dependent deacetylase
MMKAARHCVALTGAGVSTLSGIKDFRSEDGLYNMDGGAYQHMFDIDVFEQDPAAYYGPAKDFIYNLDEKQPSIVHNVLAKMEAAGLLKAIITQNIDLLHQKAGAKHVIEVHGSPSVHYCMHCSGIRMPFAEAQAIVKRGGMPTCPKCGRVLKPAITFFGEMLPQKAIYEATQEAESADLMLILGTSLTVYPAAGLPLNTLRHGGRLIIVNRQTTSLDANAAARFTELGATFEELTSYIS